MLSINRIDPAYTHRVFLVAVSWRIGTHGRLKPQLRKGRVLPIRYELCGKYPFLRDLTNAEVRYADAVLSYNRSLAELRRRTGLDQVKACPPLNLPGKKPEVDRMEFVPIEPAPNTPACEASQLGA